ncbi:MAG: YggS family pyridoxal phosphate-dependent enzyme [Verrucomicrobiota bacterium]
MSEVGENLLAVAGKITAACSRVARDAKSVELIAVSKTFSAESVREAFEAGQLVFGESRIQEAEPKIEALPGSLHWHFIGRVQRNKVRKLLQRFEVIHAIDSLRLASFADEIARELGLFPKVFLQVNVGQEASKGGFEPEVLRAEMESLLTLGRLEIIGLMCIPPVGSDAESARPWFYSLRETRDALEIEFGVKLPALSMGMSGDFEVAIEEGATHVRVGSAIFGKRSYRVDGELG